MYSKIKNRFLKVLVNSLHTKQVNYLGELLDSSFNVYRESGYGTTIPLPQQTAAETLLRYFNSVDEIVDLFTIMLRSEGYNFKDSVLKIWGKLDFIKLLQSNKWIFDPELKQFFLDPFYEHEINLLNDLRVIDLREEVQIEEIIKRITDVSEKLGKLDLEWRITLRLYDLERKSAELIRKIIQLLLSRQQLQNYAFEMFTCLKELAINASKANYKLLYEKYLLRQHDYDTVKHYSIFIQKFKDEIEENGNRRLMELAKEEDQFINITFQSTNEGIEIWVTNSQNISVREKKEIVKRIRQGKVQNKQSLIDDGYSEGAGLGINLILSILKKYSVESEPLKVVFYPDSVKIGFMLNRENLVHFKQLNEESEE